MIVNQSQTAITILIFRPATTIRTVFCLYPFGVGLEIRFTILCI